MLILVAIAVFIAISYFYFSENKKNKINEAIIRDFKASCNMLLDTLDKFKTEELLDALNILKLNKSEKKLFLEIIEEAKEIRKKSLNLVEDAEKIGPTNEGYNKLNKAMAGMEVLIKVQKTLISALRDTLFERFQDIEKLLKEKNSELEV